MSRIKILLAEDDKNLGYILNEYLTLNGYEVQLVQDGQAGLDFFKQNKVDICILDVMMPKKDGFALATEIRALDKEVPIVFLTAKSLKIDKLKAFNIGADDYIVKPVEEEELSARIQAIVKRSYRSDDSAKKTHSIGRYLFDYSNQRLSIEGREISMTQKEADILNALCIHQGSILNRKSTLKNLWGESNYFNRRSMDVFISRLRKYLCEDPTISIQNVHGRGFILKIDP